MAGDGERDKPSGRAPSNMQLTLGGIISIVGLLASGVASYSAIQTDIASLKRGEVYQERVNENVREESRLIRSELKEARQEQRETMKEFGDKVDRLIESWSNNRRR